MIDPATAILISKIICTEPRMNFRTFFHATKYYQIDRPSNYSSQANYLLDLGDALAGFVDYTTAYLEKCGAPK